MLKIICKYIRIDTFTKSGVYWNIYQVGGGEGLREKEEKFARAMRKEEGESGKTKTAAKGDRGLSGKGGALLWLLYCSTFLN